MTLARGEKRDFIVIDREGGMHALGKRILGDSAAQIRNRFSDIRRDNLPTVEQARIMVLERGQQEEKKREQAEPQRAKPEPVWDRDRADRQWQDAVVNAAIDKEKVERKYAEPDKPKPGLGCRKKEKVEAARPEPARRR